MSSNPFHCLLPVLPENFFGRWSLVKNICLDLTCETGDSYALVAGRRCGKSSTLHAISYQLNQQSIQNLANWSTIAIYMDLKGAKFKSPENIYAFILSKILLRIQEFNKTTTLGITCNELEAYWFVNIISKDEISFTDFVRSLDYIKEKVVAPKSVRYIFLFDEIDALLSYEWISGLFDQLRALIYSEEIHLHVRYIFAGSRRLFDQVNDTGSPLCNVLKVEFLEVFTDDGFSQLCKQFEGLSDEMIRYIKKISGAHPYLAQFLLYHLWKEDRSHELEPSHIDVIAQQFVHERSFDLREWGRNIGVEGLLAYEELLSGDWILETEIINKDKKLDLKAGLDSLCYHGVAIHDKSWLHYKKAGEIFSYWYKDSSEKLLSELNASKLGAQQKTEGTVINANTAFITQAGNVQYNQGLTSDEVVKLFEKIATSIEKRSDDTEFTKDEIRETVNKIKTEVQKSDNINETELEKFIRRLKGMAPDIFDVAVASWSNPVAGIGLVLKKIVMKIKAESEKG